MGGLCGDLHRWAQSMAGKRGGLQALIRRALDTVLPFATSYLSQIRTKHRSKLHIEDELRVAVSQLNSQLEKIRSTKQTHTSH